MTDKTKFDATTHRFGMAYIANWHERNRPVVYPRQYRPNNHGSHDIMYIEKDTGEFSQCYTSLLIRAPEHDLVPRAEATPPAAESDVRDDREPAGMRDPTPGTYLFKIREIWKKSSSADKEFLAILYDHVNALYVEKKVYEITAPVSNVSREDALAALEDVETDINDDIIVSGNITLSPSKTTIETIRALLAERAGGV